MARKVMKIVVLIMVLMVLAILVQANNPSFSDNLFLKHPPSLTSFQRSSRIISISPYHDAKFQSNPSDIRNNPKGKENLGPKNTQDEEKLPGSELTYSERVCLDHCRKKITYPRLSDPFLKIDYITCIRRCLRYWIWSVEISSPSLYLSLSINYFYFSTLFIYLFSQTYIIIQCSQDQLFYLYYFHWIKEWPYPIYQIFWNTWN